jgi:hypothetical protein
MDRRRRNHRKVRRVRTDGLGASATIDGVSENVSAGEINPARKKIRARLRCAGFMALSGATISQP